MEIIETNHAIMTAYEVLQVVRTRRKEAIQYKDNRDKDYLFEYDRVQEARTLMIPSLIGNSPDGTKENGKDGYDEKIPEFCERIQEMNARITPFQIRNILSVRPRNTLELGCIFPTEEEWGTISSQADSIIELVNSFFPLESSTELDLDGIDKPGNKKEDEEEEEEYEAFFFFL